MTAYSTASTALNQSGTLLVPARKDVLAAAPYECALLHPAGASGAEAHNTPLLGPGTLGVEVTEPALAARCGLGNIDPQHAGGDATRAAIEAALDHAPPPPGSRLVTIRPDVDAFGTMAVLSRRAEGKTIDDIVRVRVAAIAAADRAVDGLWPGPRPLPETPGDFIGILGRGGDVPALTAACFDRSLSPTARVGLVRNWIETGRLPEIYRQRIGERTTALAEAWGRGEVSVRPMLAGRAALVRSTADGVLRLGYRIAPVVLALNPCASLPNGRAGRKVTICQWGDGHVGLASLARRLNVIEPGWDGSPTIIGSPQGTGTRLPLAQIITCLAGHLNR